MNTKTLVMAAAMSLSLPFLNAQDTTRVRIKPYGFVRNYLGIDSRRMMTTAGEEFLLIPYDEDWNMTEAQAETYGQDERVDRNGGAQSHLLALSTRFGLALTGPRLLGAASSGKLEADFAGFGSTNTVLRLRLAYVKLDWQAEGRASHELLVGQDWHPLSGSVMPDVLGMAAGAPFRPHSRPPQVRYTFTAPGGLGFTVAALWQYQSTSPGPQGESALYANRAVVPELFLGVGYRTDHLFAQLGVDYTDLSLRQEMTVTDPYGDELYLHIFQEHCRSLSPTVYLQYSRDLLCVKMRSTLASNLGHLGMFSGYAWAASHSDADYAGYRPMRAWASYLNMAYGHRVKANILLGYHRNLGLGDDYCIAFQDPDYLYMKKGVKNIGHIFRLAPSISYNTRAFNLGIGYEWTAVGYGDAVNADGTVDVKRQVDGHRLLAMVKYNF